MLTLTARQCPRCELRFGSSSELEQHLQSDHRSAAAQPEPATGTARRPGGTDDRRPPTEQPADARRFVGRTIVAAALIATVAVISWHVAALVSVVLVAVVAARASERAAEKERRWTR